MQTIYIVFICAASLFVVLFLVYVIRACIARRNYLIRQRNIKQAYSDSNLAKMEYDVAVYDDEINNADSSDTKDKTTSEGKEADVNKEDKSDDSAESQSDDSADSDETEALFEKVDNEGMEEITGNFKGD